MRKPKPPVLGQKYRLIRQLDAGGMASVWAAEAVHLSSLVAVKIMDRALAATPQAAQRFLLEARTAASLRSPHVVQILDYGVHESTPFIAMELLEGESLAARLDREGRLASWEQTELVLRHVARALGRAHDAGVIHRDLKPANIFLVRDEEEEIVKLLDFGIAKTTAEQTGSPIGNNTRTGEFLGSPAYASPEQLQASKDLDHRADIWSLGVIAYECLLGRLPFVSDSFVGLLLAICTGPLPIPSEQGSVPDGFDAWFARACAREVGLRFQNVREASAELRRLFATACGSRPPQSRPETSAPPAVERAPLELASSAPFELPGSTPFELPENASLEHLEPSRTDAVLLVSRRAPGPSPTHELAEVPTGTVRLAEVPTGTVRLAVPGRRVAPHRKAMAVSVALALPAIVALVFFTLDASTSRAALERKLLGLGGSPPSEATRADTRAGDERPRLDPPAFDGPPPSPVEPPRPDPGEPDVAGAQPAPAPVIRVVPDAIAPSDTDVVAALGGAPPSSIPPASEAASSPPAPRHPEALRPRRAAKTLSSSARLTITASEPSDVWLDGKPLGSAPLEGIRVEPGSHEITFVHDGQRSVQTLTLRSGEHKRVEARIGTPPGDGLDEAAVKRTIKSYRDAVVDTCWEHAFGVRSPGAPTSIRVPVTISVEPSGEVQSVVTAAEPAGYPELRRCVEGKVSAWRFPSARAETVVSVAFVFVLK